MTTELPEEEQVEQRVESNPAAAHGTRNDAPKPVRTGKFYLIIALLATGLLAEMIHTGIATRVSAESMLARETNENAVPYVSVTHPRESAPAEELVLPGNMQAFTDSPIYARTNGYLKRWYVDIGARVKTGELLAEIDTPEVDQQLQQAKADLETAQANMKLAQSTAVRYQDLLKTESVSQQETDEKVGDLKAKKAIVDSAAANVHRLEDLQSYEKVYAPFDGVITARNTDVGALINSGSSTPGKELFHIAAINKLRVFVSVPEVYSQAAKPGLHASLTLTEFPGRSFVGTLARNSSSIDPASRTLLVEVDVDNPSSELLPGAYVSAHLKLPTKGGNAVTIPVDTLLFRSEGLRVGVVRNNRVALVPIAIGRDYGNEVEVVTGLSPNDVIVVNPSDSLTAGQEVHVSGFVKNQGSTS